MLISSSNTSLKNTRQTHAGTLVTASAHIITAVIGSGVLSLAWAVAQLGWVIGPVVLVAFSAITWFCSSLLADCYRAPDPVHGKRNYTYGQAVRAYLGTTVLTAVAHKNGCFVPVID
jgi:amino acid permease